MDSVLLSTLEEACAQDGVLGAIAVDPNGFCIASRGGLPSGTACYFAAMMGIVRAQLDATQTDPVVVVDLGDSKLLVKSLNLVTVAIHKRL
eukprot:TRINITY_DN7552_c0_g1_i2.p2 TRINITY_DN7552_c0_g1~~TRINITY_DN7552_c0_g1_i2.p2  ORF type:complete len:101 (+),score=35.21 TRINITY_DN7552_c0_g1_i2:33-305(+)